MQSACQDFRGYTGRMRALGSINSLQAYLVFVPRSHHLHFQGMNVQKITRGYTHLRCRRYRLKVSSACIEGSPTCKSSASASFCYYTIAWYLGMTISETPYKSALPCLTRSSAQISRATLLFVLLYGSIMLDRLVLRIRR